MARTHYIFCRERQTFFRTCQGEPVPYLPDAPTKAEADLYAHKDALTIAHAFYGKEWLHKCELIEATASDHALWRCRRAGQVSTPRKTQGARRAIRVRWQRHRKRVCKACGKRMSPKTPINIHTCKRCQ